MPPGHQEYLSAAIYMNNYSFFLFFVNVSYVFLFGSLCGERVTNSLSTRSQIVAHYHPDWHPPAHGVGSGPKSSSGYLILIVDTLTPVKEVIELHLTIERHPITESLFSSGHIAPLSHLRRERQRDLIIVLPSFLSRFLKFYSFHRSLALTEKYSISLSTLYD
ncbi:hypothetical protein ACFL21_00170 [Patescibacteria group bacterium]